MAEAGQRAPEFSLIDTAGRQVTLSGLLRRGAVVLVFYRGHWCPFCRRHLKKLQGNLDRIRTLGASLVAVSVDERPLARRMADELGLEFAVVGDRDGATIDAYGVRNRLLGIAGGIPHPALFIIDSQGVVRFREVSHDYRRRTTPSRMLRALGRIVTGDKGTELSQ
jgi:peroxiredoxin